MARKKVRKVVVLLGSPRKQGNSATLAARIAAGAKSAGAEVETFLLNEMQIAPCSACDECREPQTRWCAIDDDMQLLYPKLKAADALVIASPVYWFTMSAQTKLVMDRCYALQRDKGHEFSGKRVAIAMSYADADAFGSGCVNALRTFQDVFRYVGAEIVGMVYGSAIKAGDIKANKPLLKSARALGHRLVTGA